jgi:hypothetical protein
MKNNSNALKIAREVMDLARRRGYGLGECGFYFESYAWDVIEEKYDDIEYDMYDLDDMNRAERARLKEERPEIFREWLKLTSEAEEIAEKMEELGVIAFR